MKTIAAAVTLLLVAQPLAAHASRSCGSGGSSDSDSSSNSSSSSSSSSSESSNWSSLFTSSSSSSEPTPACIDDTDVVGYRQCKRFGGWGMNPHVPRFFLELGTNVRQFSSTGTGGRTGSVWHGSESFSFRTIAPTPGGDGNTAVASSLRLGFGLRNGLYAGLEGELGGLTTSATSAEMMSSGVYGTPVIESRSALLFSGAAFLGARASMGRISVAVEAAGGARNIRYRYTSNYHNCEDLTSVSVVQPMLEARTRAELWLNPWVAVGAQAGANVAARGDWMTGVYLGLHNRAFGGR